MEEVQQSSLTKLNEKVLKLIDAYGSLKRRVHELEEENASLRAQTITSKAQSEVVENRISKLEEEITLKDLQADDISFRIEEIFKD
jgi:FtsZ-binding cell division protein ZapB